MHSLFTDLLYSAPHGGIGCGQKIFNLVKRCHQLLPGFLAKGDLPRVSRHSHFSANIKGDYEMIPETVYRYVVLSGLGVT